MGWGCLVAEDVRLIGGCGDFRSGLQPSDLWRTYEGLRPSLV